MKTIRAGQLWSRNYADCGMPGLTIMSRVLLVEKDYFQSMIVSSSSSDVESVLGRLIQMDVPANNAYDASLAFGWELVEDNVEFANEISRVENYA